MNLTMILLGVVVGAYAHNHRALAGAVVLAVSLVVAAVLRAAEDLEAGQTTAAFALAVANAAVGAVIGAGGRRLLRLDLLTRTARDAMPAAAIGSGLGSAGVEWADDAGSVGPGSEDGR